MEDRDFGAIALSGLAAFLIFLGGWTVFTTLSIFSEVGFSSGWMVEGIPPLTLGISVGIFFGGIVLLYLGYRYSSVDGWSLARYVFAFVLVALLVGQAVYSYEGVEGPPDDGNGDGNGDTPSDPSLSGSYKLFAGGVALSDNVPFGIYYNDVRLGGKAVLSLDSDLVLKDFDGNPGGVQFGIAFQYSYKRSGQWVAWKNFPVTVNVPNPYWRRSGSSWKCSIDGLEVYTIDGTDDRFFYGGGECRFRLNIYATLGGSLSTSGKWVEFILENRKGSLEIEYVGGWPS